MSDEVKRLHAIVSGRVQGVSFRYYTTLKANELGLVGWVHNRRDGKVELIAEGADSDLDALESWLHEGSPHARVDSVDVSREEGSGEFTEFRTVYFRDRDE